MRVLVSVAVLGVLALALVVLLSALELDYRLDRFLPRPADPAQALVADQLGDNASARMILAGISGASPDILAEAARAQAARWQDVPGVRAVWFGEPDLQSEDPWASLNWLLDDYLLLIPDPAPRLTDAAVRQSLQARLADLATAGAVAEPLVRRDPLGLLPELESVLTPVRAENLVDGVWFDADEVRALLLVMTDAAGFDPHAQRAIVDGLRAGFDALPGAGELTLELSGPGVFSTDLDRAARSEAGRLTLLACAWILLLLWLAWRRPALMLAGAVPLAAGIVAGLAALYFGFDAVFGLTLAFGFTLLGVTVDYPVHVFAHQATGARAVRAPLSLSALSSLIAFSAIWISASPGLAQLGAFSAVGLLTAAAVALWYLPALRLPAPPPPPAIVTRALHAPRAPWLPPLAMVVALGGVALMAGKLWSDDLSRISPLKPQWLQTDAQLRQALGAPEVRYLLVLHEAELEQVLQATETLDQTLAAAREQGLIDSWQAVTTLVPSQASQARRRAAWPDPGQMRESLRTASQGLPFRPDAFDPFVNDLERLGARPAITPDTWHDTPLEVRVDNLLAPTGHGWRALVYPAGLNDPVALGRWLNEAGSPAEVVDLAAVSRTMTTRYRHEVLVSLGVAVVLITLLVASRLRSASALVRVLTPPLAAVAITALIMTAASGGLNVIHLMALILVTGIGLDYALFMQHFQRCQNQAASTLWSLILCAGSTGGVFAILGTSTIPMLANLGRTCALGIFLALIMVWLARERTN